MINESAYCFWRFPSPQSDFLSHLFALSLFHAHTHESFQAWSLAYLSSSSCLNGPLRLTQKKRTFSGLERSRRVRSLKPQIRVLKRFSMVIFVFCLTKGKELPGLLQTSERDTKRVFSGAASTILLLLLLLLACGSFLPVSFPPFLPSWEKKNPESFAFPFGGKKPRWKKFTPFLFLPFSLPKFRKNRHARLENIKAKKNSTFNIPFLVLAFTWCSEIISLPIVLSCFHRIHLLHSASQAF